MSITFNADEIFEMAIQIESNGAKFYKQAAEKATDEKMKTMFKDMAAMEITHQKTFESMKQELKPEEKEQTVFDPDNEAVKYLQTMADSKGWEGKVSLDQSFTGEESSEEILKAAIQAEKNSVVFYTGIKDMVPDKAGKDKIDNIIREEIGHLAILNLSLSAS